MMTVSVLVAARQQRWSDERMVSMPPVAPRARAVAADSYWLATVRPDGRAHVLPALEVWLDGALYVSAGPFFGGGEHPADAVQYVISVARQALDLVVEGVAASVTDEATLRRVAAEFASRYGWQRPAGVMAGIDGPAFPYEVYRATRSPGFDADAMLDTIHWRF